MKLDEQGLKMLLLRAGLAEVPRTPSRWDYPFQTLFLELIIASGFAAVGALAAYFRFKQRVSVPVTEGHPPDQERL